MKVETKSKEFQPIVITLETEAEAECIADALSQYIGSKDAQRAFLHSPYGNKEIHTGALIAAHLHHEIRKNL